MDIQIRENAIEKNKSGRLKVLMKQEIAIYLAWPDVFKWWTIEQKKEIANEMKEICQKYGFQWNYPLDNEIDGTDKENIRKHIFSANIKMMNKSDIILANISAFRWPHSDIWTGFEQWYMFWAWKPIYWYNRPNISLVERIWIKDENWDDVEDFENSENLMIEEGIKQSWWKIIFAENEAWSSDKLIFLKNFEETIQTVRKDIEDLRNELCSEEKN
jgi:nucleoside 2-deoxyribosyltransferase